MYAPNGLSTGPIPNEFGFVGRLITGGTIQNLNLTNGYLNGDSSDNIGSFVGVLHWGNIENGTITIQNCYSDLTVVCNSSATDHYAGGIYACSWRSGTGTIQVNVINVTSLGRVTNTKVPANVGIIAGRAGWTSGESKMVVTYTDCYSPAAGKLYATLGGATLTNHAAKTYIQKSAVDPATNTFSARILCGVDSMNWDNVGIRVTVTKADGTVITKNHKIYTLYESVRAGKKTVHASDLDPNYRYLYGVVIKGIPADLGESLIVAPFRTVNGMQATSRGSFYETFYGGASVKWEDFENENVIPDYGAVESGSYTIDGNSEMKEYKNASKDTFSLYISKLKIAGYTVSQENMLGNNLYAFASNGVANVYVSYIDSKHVVRLYSEAALRANPIDTEDTAKATYTPKMWQLRVDNITSRENGGMSYVWLLSDGTFFIIDGGYNTKTEADNLYNFLKSKNPLDGEPVISGWYFSHGHGDHIGAIQAFAPGYADRVEVKAFYYHFEVGYPTGFDSATAYWPDAVHYSRLHTGQTVNLPGIRFHVIYTLEDLYNTGFSFNSLNYNNHSAVIRVDVEAGGKTNKVMYLGDIQLIASNCIMKNFSGNTDALKSNIVQFSHHGYAGGTIELYDAIHAPTVLWPINIVSTQANYGKICNVFSSKSQGGGWNMAGQSYTMSETNPTGGTETGAFPNYYMCHQATYCIQILLAGDELEADEITFPYTARAYEDGIGLYGRLPAICDDGLTTKDFLALKKSLIDDLGLTFSFD